MIKVEFIKEYESDRTYKVGEVAEFEDQKATNLVSVELAKFVTKETKKEKSSNE